jgi:hypothetical protein
LWSYRGARDVSRVGASIGRNAPTMNLSFRHESAPRPQPHKRLRPMGTHCQRSTLCDGLNQLRRSYLSHDTIAWCTRTCRSDGSGASSLQPGTHSRVATCVGFAGLSNAHAKGPKGKKPVARQRCGSVSVRLHVSRHFSFDICVLASHAASHSCIVAPVAPCRLLLPPPVLFSGFPMASRFACA